MVDKVKIFTDEFFEQVPGWVKEGLTPKEIAAKAGGSVGSLKTLCSLRHISLKNVNFNPDTRVLAEYSLELTQGTRHTFRVKAHEMNLPLEILLALVLEQVANDDLFSALELEMVNDPHTHKV